MARVNHKTILRLIGEERSKVNDKQFFTSPVMRGHFADIAAAQTKRYGYNRRVRVQIVWEPRNKCVARTDDQLIYINAGHALIKALKTRLERYEFIRGLFAHELGHVLYTDFLMMQTYSIQLLAGKWFPDKPANLTSSELIHEAQIQQYIAESDEHKQAALFIAHELNNILEDGFVEERIRQRYPGVLGMSINKMRIHSFEQLQTVTQLIELEESGESQTWQTLEQIILSYVVWGEIKYGETDKTDFRIRALYQAIPIIDEALAGQAQDRWDATNRLLIRHWPHVKAFLDHWESQKDDADDLLGQIVTILGTLNGATQIGSGVSSPVEDDPAGPATPSSGLVAKRAVVKAEMDPQNGDNTPDCKANDSDANELQRVTAEETDRLPQFDTTAVSTGIGGQTLTDNDYSGSGYQHAADDIDRLLTNIAEQRVCGMLEKQRTSELNEIAQSMSLGNAHEGVQIVIHRISIVAEEMRERYSDAAPPLLHISKQLQRNVTRELHDRRAGGKNTGLYMGRRLDAHTLHRNDGRIFYKNNLPNDTPEIAVALLLDESGSMGGRDRATYARATAIILHDFCLSLGIPIMVYGHSTDQAHDGSVDLYAYAEFDVIDKNDCYRLMDISSRNCNRDGAALRFVAEQLSKRHADIRLLILVSDGQPSGDGYHGTAAEEDLRGIKHEYKRKGVTLIAAAIGDDKENIERIYGDAFLDITDLHKLPVVLTDKIKKYLRI